MPALRCIAHRQEGFLGPALLLHLLQPKLAASGTQLLLTASPAHRRGTLCDHGSDDKLARLLGSWAAGSHANTQVCEGDGTTTRSLRPHAQQRGFAHACTHACSDARSRLLHDCMVHLLLACALQAALLCYVRELAEELAPEGVTAAAVDVGA